MLKLRQLAGFRVVLKVAVTTVTHAGFGLTVVTVRFHVFPTFGQSDEVGEMTVEIEVTTLDVDKFVAP
jgi:hypothetical protein